MLDPRCTDRPPPIGTTATQRLRRSRLAPTITATPATRPIIGTTRPTPASSSAPLAITGASLNRMLGKLGPGDVVTVTRIDRLARSTFDLFGIVKRVVDAKAQFRSLAEPWPTAAAAPGA